MYVRHQIKFKVCDFSYAHTTNCTYVLYAVITGNYKRITIAIVHNYFVITL